MKKNKNRISLIILCIIVLLTTLSCGTKMELPEASQDFYVYDKLGIIDRTTKNYIININQDLYEKTGAQVVVALVESLEDLDINSYATSLYEKWEIGSKEYDNGILILISPNDGLMWIEVGYGLEGRFPDSKIKRIIDNYMIPYFADDMYGAGISSGFNQIILAIEEEYDIRLEGYEGRDNPPISRDSDDEDRIVFPNIFLILGVILFVFIDYKLFRGMLIYSILRGLGRGGRSGGYGGSSGRGGGSSGGGGRSGGGGAGGSW